jgi:hypothetical protein
LVTHLLIVDPHATLAAMDALLRAIGNLETFDHMLKGKR